MSTWLIADASPRISPHTTFTHHSVNFHNINLTDQNNTRQKRSITWNNKWRKYKTSKNEAITCIPKSGNRSCRVENGGAPSNWRPHRSRELCWMRRSCSAAFPATVAVGATPTAGHRRPPAYPVCPAWSREKGTASRGDRRARGAAASSLEPFRLYCWEIEQFSSSDAFFCFFFSAFACVCGNVSPGRAFTFFKQARAWLLPLSLPLFSNFFFFSKIWAFLVIFKLNSNNLRLLSIYNWNELKFIINHIKYEIRKELNSKFGNILVIIYIRTSSTANIHSFVRHDKLRFDIYD